MTRALGKDRALPLPGLQPGSLSRKPGLAWNGVAPSLEGRLCRDPAALLALRGLGSALAERALSPSARATPRVWSRPGEIRQFRGRGLHLVGLGEPQTLPAQGLPARAALLLWPPVGEARGSGPSGVWAHLPSFIPPDPLRESPTGLWGVLASGAAAEVPETCGAVPT